MRGQRQNAPTPALPRKREREKKIVLPSLPLPFAGEGARSAERDGWGKDHSQL
jgi:hypothetical protein